MPPVAATAAILALLAMPAAAQQQQQQPQQAGARPQALGTFQEWTAATYQEGGQKICYAFTRAGRSDPQREGVILTVTHRPQGRDQVALSAGYAYPRNAEVEVSVGGTELPFYTASTSAFARDGRAAVAAFRNGRVAVARGPASGSRGAATDSFPLVGFTAAYEAITRACPAGGGGAATAGGRSR